MTTPPIRITLATLEDAPLVYTIMRTAFEEYVGVLNPPAGVFAETVEDVIRAMGDGGAVLAWVGDQAAGSARYTFRADKTCYVGRVSVLPEYRGHGIASSMMLFIEDIAREHDYKMLEISVRMVLENNVHLYEHIGYKITEVFEHPKGGALIGTMVKRLNDDPDH